MKVTEERLLDTYLAKFKDMEILFEAITPEQKEKGQRVMSEKSILPFEKLRTYLIEKWNNLPRTKENFLKIKNEKGRFNFLLELLTDKKLEKSKNGIYKVIVDKETSLKKTNREIAGDSYISSLTGNKPQVYVSKGDRTAIVSDYDGLPHFVISDKVGARTNGIKLDIEPKEIRKKVRKFIVYHEYGHLYEFIKDFVENGEAEVTDTATANNVEKEESEGKANAYAIDNMYRKDRREILKKAKPDNNSEDAISYRRGMINHSKTLKDTILSIDKERRHFNY